MIDTVLVPMCINMFELPTVITLYYNFFILISYPPRCPDPPVMVVDSKSISSAVALLRRAKQPLVIIGKGMLSCTSATKCRMHSFKHFLTHCTCCMCIRYVCRVAYSSKNCLWFVCGEKEQ